MARIKTSNEPLININDWAHADRLVKEIGEIQADLTAEEGDAAEEINKIKAHLAGLASNWHARQKLIVNSLEAFALAHTKDFNEARSRKLDFGTIGWRKSTVIVIAATTLEYIKALFSPAKQKTVLHIKEAVDKEALARFTDEELATIKARRKSRDVFFVEPLLTEAAEH